MVGEDIFHRIVAYAEKQAWICEQLARSCVVHWLPTVLLKGITPEWALSYIALGVVAIPQSLPASTEFYCNGGEEALGADEDEDEEVDDENIGLDCDEEDIDIDGFELDD